MLRIFHLLKMAFQRVKLLSEIVKELPLDVYYNKESNTVTKSKYHRACRCTLKKKGLYLVLMGNEASIGGGTNTMGVWYSSDQSTNITKLIACNGRSIMSSGGGVTTWALVRANVDNAVVGSSGYGYYTSSYTNTGYIVAIRIPEVVVDFSGGVVKLCPCLYWRWCV